MSRRYILCFALLTLLLLQFACGPQWIELVPNQDCKEALQSLDPQGQKGCMVFRQKSDLVWILEYKSSQILYCLDDSGGCTSPDIKMPPPPGEQEEAILLFPPSEEFPLRSTRREIAAACNAILGRLKQPTCWNEAGSPPDSKRCWTLLQIKPDATRQQAQCSALSLSP
ncbi:MAG: hypothetical protein H6727_06020 [Myxococcales bacterium]|nr:hypothetical protein [Myxococcales bacterium]